MRTLDEYMKLPYRMEIVPDPYEGGFVIAIREPHELDSYSGQFKLRIPKSLHRRLAEQARQEGISMNQYCVYLLSRNA